MNPDDVQVSEEVGDEEAIPAKALPSPTQPTRREIQEHELTHLPSSIVVWALSEGEGNKPSAFSQ